MHKYDPEMAQRPVRLERSDKGDSRNIRILMARGLKHAVAERVARAIRAGEVNDPDAYAWSVVGDEANLDPRYLAWRDESAFDPEVWRQLQSESEKEIEYTTPIKKRLRRRAIEKEEELRLAEFYEMDESDYFWRESSRRFNSGSSSHPATAHPNPHRSR